MITNLTKTYTSSFWLLCLSSLLFFASFNMIIPELPAYLTQLGGAEYKGLIISLFTITAMVSRPFSGKLADKIGRVPVMIFGALVCLICSLFYPLISSLAGFFLLRLVHGFSTGFTPTGTTAYLSDIIPAQRRGEAMGLLGTAGAVGMAGGPALGGLLSNQFGLDFMFYGSSLLAFIAIAILLRTKETLKTKTKFSIDYLKVKRQDIFEPLVLAPCLVMMLCAFSYGAVFTVIPDFGEFVGIKIRVYSSPLTVASLVVRLLAGKASDRYGRVSVLRVSTVVMGVAMVIVGTATTSGQLIVGVSLYGLSQGSASPTLLAWATDLSHDQFKGRGIASLYIFMEFGIGIGAFVSGLIYANDPSKFFITFLMSGMLSALAFLYLLVRPQLIKI
ncbi:MAG: MFS transporter [Flammeovirgaceae bacterium]|nr:MFS transporter [Flammeovirgaceae bacterium]